MAVYYVNLSGTITWVASRLKLENVFTWEYTGDLAPDDRLVINRERRTILLNGIDVRHLISGEIPFFEPGISILSYSDNEVLREVRIRLVWRGRWL